MWSLITEVFLWSGVRKITFLIFDPIICFESKNNISVTSEFQLVTLFSIYLDSQIAVMVMKDMPQEVLLWHQWQWGYLLCSEF